MSKQRRSQAGKAFLEIFESGPDTKAAWERAKVRLQAVAKIMRSAEWQQGEREWRRGWKEVAKVIQEELRHAGRELEARHFTLPQSIEEWEHLALIAEIPFETVQSGKLTAREIYACALAWADRQKIKANLTLEASPTAPRADTTDATGNGRGKAPARRGRKKLSDKESKRRLEVLRCWEQASGAGVLRKRFCEDEGIKSRELQTYQDWARQRENRKG